MAQLEVRCEVSLWESIVLATQDNTRYATLEWTLASGSRVAVKLDVNDEVARQRYAERSSGSGYFVNTKAGKLFITLTLNDVSEMDISRLTGRSTTEETFRAHFETASGPLDFEYQAAPELGKRIVGEIGEVANRIIRFIRINYGQHWLEPGLGNEPDQNFLDSVHARWLDDGKWTPLVIGPSVISISSVFIGGTREYLEPSDWDAIGVSIAKGETPTEVYSLVSDAKWRYEDGDKQIAILHLNSAMEAAVDRFLEEQLKGKIPAASLKNILKENYDRLLNNWVLPLSDDLSLNLRNEEWNSIRRIQELRREAGHPDVVTGIAGLGELEWLRLVKDAISAIAKLTQTSPPKSPQPMWAEVQSGIE